MHRIAVLFAALALLVGASATFAAAEIAFTGIGGHLDYVDPENVDAVLGFGGLVDLGMVTPEIGLEGNVDFWSKSYDFGVASASLRVISIGATGKYYFAAKDVPLRPFAGAGLAVHLAHGSVDYPADYFSYAGYTLVDTSSDDTKIGIDICGGTLYGLNEKLDLLGELRYRLVSDVNQLVVRAGVIYRMGQ
jgi:opacity protein-like surface antigen